MEMPEVALMILQTTARVDSLLEMPFDSRVFVPSAIVTQGREAVVNYILESNYTPAPHIKVVMLGSGGAGKTSMILAMKQVEDAPFSFFSKYRQIELSATTNSTIGVDIGEGPKKIDSRISFTFYDMAGQLEYMSCHQVLSLSLSLSLARSLALSLSHSLSPSN